MPARAHHHRNRGRSTRGVDALGTGLIAAGLALAMPAAGQDPPSTEQSTAPVSDLARLLSKPLCEEDFTSACFEGVQGNSLGATVFDGGYGVALKPDKYSEGGWTLVNVEMGRIERGFPAVGPLTLTTMSRRLQAFHGVIDERTLITGARYGGRGSFRATTLGGGKVTTFQVSRSTDYVDPAYVAEKIARQFPGSVLGGGGSSWTVDAYVGEVFVHYSYRACEGNKKLCIEKTVEPLRDVMSEVDALVDSISSEFIAARMAALRTESRGEFQAYYAGIGHRTLDDLEAKLASWRGEQPRRDWISRQLEPARVAVRAASLAEWPTAEVREVQARIDAYAAELDFEGLPNPYISSTDRRWDSWRFDHLDDLMGGATAAAEESLSSCGAPSPSRVIGSEPAFFGRYASILVSAEVGSSSAKGHHPLLIDSDGRPRVLVPCSFLDQPRFLSEHPEWQPWFEGGEGYDLTEMLVGPVDACAAEVGVGWANVAVHSLEVRGDQVVAACQVAIEGTLHQFTIDLPWEHEHGAPEFDFQCPPWPSPSLDSQPPTRASGEPQAGAVSPDSVPSAEPPSDPAVVRVDWATFRQENGGLPNLTSWVSAADLDRCVAQLPPDTKVYLAVKVLRTGDVSVISGTGRPVDDGLLTCATEIATGLQWPAVTKGSARNYGMLVRTK